MAQIKPIDLKKIAKRFTEKFYPDWVSRFDRIWAMLEKLEPDSITTGTDKSQSQLGNAFGITGMAGPESQECIGGIAVLAFTYRQVQNKSSVSEDEVRQKISIIPNFKITPALQRKLEHVLAEMVPSMKQGIAEQDENQSIKSLVGVAPEGSDDKSFVVYVGRSSGFGVNRYVVPEDELHSKFLYNKEKFDIIVYQHNVEVKSVDNKVKSERIQFIPIDLYSNILSLLILFLKYKDEALPYLVLYHCAWKDGVDYDENVTDIADIIDDLKTGVSSLRKKLEIVENFIIPPAKRKANVYVCKGGFNFCLILKDSMDQKHILKVD